MRITKILLLVLTIALVGVGCKKRKIEKNLNGIWNLSGLFINGENNVTQYTSYQLEFTGVKKGEGRVNLIATDSLGTYIDTGVVFINDDYNTMKMTFIGDGYTMNMEGSFDVDKSNFNMNGEFLDSNAGTGPVRIKGSK